MLVNSHAACIFGQLNTGRRLPMRQIPIILLFCTALAGCATDPFRVVPLPAGTDPHRELERLESGLEQASDQDVDVYSGRYYAKAQAAIEEAKACRSSGGSNVEILQRLSDARAYLDYAIWRAGFGREAL